MSDEKKSFLQIMSEQLLKWDSELNELIKKGDNIKENAKEDYKENIEKLKLKKNDLQKKLEELKDTGGDAWHSMKEGLDNASKDLKSAFSEAISKFKNKNN